MLSPEEKFPAYLFMWDISFLHPLDIYIVGNGLQIPVQDILYTKSNPCSLLALSNPTVSNVNLMFKLKKKGSLNTKENGLHYKTS